MTFDLATDPESRMRVALAELYDYFRRRERLWTNILRDQEMPYLKDNQDVYEIMRPMVEHWERMQRTLAAGWQTHNGTSRPLLGTIGLALDFQSWRTMVRRQGLTDEQAIDLMVGLVRCTTHS